MTNRVSRRKFMTGLGMLTLASSARPASALTTLYESLPGLADPSSFFSPTSAARGGVKIGYAAITWGGQDLQAIKEISELGFKGIQLRSNILKEWGERPKELRALLEQHHLELVALSSGGVRIAPGTEKDEIAKHVRNATFMRDAGGRYLQVTDSARAKDRAPTPEDFKQLGHVLTEIGKRASDLGIPLGYHNHMHSLGESPDEVDRILEASDPRHVKLELDIAHYQQGGGDPSKAIGKYRDRLLFLHIKDVESLKQESPTDSARPYRFVELGRGRVDLPAVFKALKEIKFGGWAVVELDSVPDKARSPKESAVISKKYLEEKLGMKI